MEKKFFDRILLVLLLSLVIYRSFAQYTNVKCPDVSVFEDKSGRLNIHEILSPEFQHRFVDFENNIPTFPFTKSVVWCKLRIDDELKQKGVYLDIRPKILNYVVLYSVGKSGQIDSLVSGTLSGATNNLKGELLLLYLNPHSKQYYLKVKTNTRMYLDLRLKIFDELVFKKGNMVMQGIYAGILLMIFIYNLFLFFTLKDRTFFYYLLHLTATFLNFLYLSGIGTEYFWSAQIWVSKYFISIMSIGFVFTGIFVIKFLDTFHNSKLLHKGLLLSIAMLFVVSIIDLSGFHILAVKLLNVLGFIIVIYIILTSIIIWYKGYKPAGIFLTAWVLYFTGISIQVLQGFNLLPTTIVTANGMLIGSAFELVLLSLSVGYKINYLKEQMRLAAINEQKALNEKELLIKEENIRLEQLAEEQSKQIKKKNKEFERQYTEILEKNKKVKQQNEILHKVNKQLEEKNKIIEKQHGQLLYHKNNLENIILERTKELQEAVEKVKEADEAKTAFLRNVSHEIRTPMNAISGFASLLLNISPKEHRYSYYVDIIYKSTENLFNIIDNIIELSKIQTGTLKLKKVKFYPKKMFNELYNLFLTKIKEEKKFFVSLNKTEPKNNDLKVYMDYNRLWIVLYHLLDNAVKYTDTGFIDFGYKKNENEEFEIIVKDSGKGIKKDDMKAVFEYFRKTDKNINRLYAGMGLGLSLVKELVQLMNGIIIVNSISQEEAKEQNSGTKFILRFPDVLIE